MVMAHIVVLGAGIGGTSLAWELAGSLGDGHSITVIGDGPRFSFIPSNPWVAVGWRSADDVEVDLEAVMKRRGIEFVTQPAAAVHPDDNQVELADGQRIDYDYLAIATGARLAFEDVPGLGPDGHNVYVCTTGHADSDYYRSTALVA